MTAQSAKQTLNEMKGKQFLIDGSSRVELLENFTINQTTDMVTIVTNHETRKVSLINLGAHISQYQPVRKNISAIAALKDEDSESATEIVPEKINGLALIESL